MSLAVIGGLVATLLAATAPAPDPSPPQAPVAAIDQALRATLLQMGRDDQDPIGSGIGNPDGNPTENEALESHRIRRKNHDLIRKIVREHGWPGKSLAGEDGAHAAWLVVQHMDHDLDFQRSCLALMQQSFLAGEVSAHDFAYLTDRVRTHEGRPQMYGTQGLGVLSAEDEARVNGNRAAIGLPPWRVAVEKRQKDYANGYGGAAAKSP